MFDLERAIEVLSATPGVLRSLLAGASDHWTGSSEAGSWSAAEVLAHLVAGEETDWIPRTRIILEHGTSKAFAPFDRDARPETDVAALLDAFEEARARNLSTLRELDLTGERLELRGVHPEFGEVRLADMLATWTVHDLSHIAQMTETMAKRWREEVGPWRRYLPVLDREELPSD